MTGLVPSAYATCLVLAICAAAPAAAVPVAIVAPIGNASAEAGYLNRFPFFDRSTMRYRQAFGASAFSALTTPARITTMSIPVTA